MLIRLLIYINVLFLGVYMACSLVTACPYIHQNNKENCISVFLPKLAFLTQFGASLSPTSPLTPSHFYLHGPYIILRNFTD